MKPPRLFVFALLLGAASLPGQNMTDKTGTGSWAKHEDFASAWLHCRHLLEHDSMNSELNFQMGMCYLNSRSQKNKALAYFQKAFKTKTTGPDMQKLMADAFYESADFDQASTHYILYRDQLIAQGSPSYAVNAVGQHLELCRLGKELNQLKEMLNMAGATRLPNPTSASGSVDPSSDSGASSTPDVNKVFARNDESFFEDDGSIQAQKAEYNLKDTVGFAKEGTVATSFDGQIMLIYRNDEGEGNLYLSMLEGNDWTVPDRVNKAININGWETGEYLSVDGTAMYFTSDRTGGYGGKDIYKCEKLPNGEWSKAINLGYPINTPYDDVAPCILPDGVTFYFSSNRNKSKNNFDLYTSTFADSGKWTTPVSIGYPVKKETPVRKSAVERAPEKDNYLVTFNTTKNIPLTLLRGRLTDQNDKFPASTEITITDNITGNISGIYHPDENIGHYNLLLPPGRNNNVTFEAQGYLFHSENADLSAEPSIYKVVPPTVLRPLSENSTEILNNVFFASNSATPQTHSLPELRKLCTFLKNYPGCSIELGCAGVGPADNGEKTRLAAERAQAVAGFLTEKGIARERIATHAYVATKKKRRHQKKMPTLAITDQEKIEIKITEIK